LEKPWFHIPMLSGNAQVISVYPEFRDIFFSRLVLLYLSDLLLLSSIGSADILVHPGKGHPLLFLVLQFQTRFSTQ
jgi:hypothetical protein